WAAPALHSAFIVAILHHWFPTLGTSFPIRFHTHQYENDFKPDFPLLHQQKTRPKSTLTVQPKSQVQTTFIPSSLETPTKNQEKINTFCPLSQMIHAVPHRLCARTATQNRSKENTPVLRWPLWATPPTAQSLFSLLVSLFSMVWRATARERTKAPRRGGGAAQHSQGNSCEIRKRPAWLGWPRFP
ncbi:hypothetical protein, partial [Mobiluncus mulieris]|uniref:hypothetical protein n=1 Tax=Mobiluncus mulieris TaxID=2052 RepID=UPI001B8C14EB